MKFLLIFTLIGFVSCTDSEVQEAIAQAAASTPTELENVADSVNSISNTTIEGEYKSYTCEPDNRLGFKSYVLNVYSGSVKVSAIYHLEDDCTDTGYDRVYAWYDIVGEGLQYREAVYVDMMNDEYQACGLNNLNLGLSYNIDGVGCALSFESVDVSITDNGDNTATLLNKIFR